MVKRSKSSKKAWAKALPQRYEDLPEPDAKDAPSESVFGFIDRVEKLQRKVDGKPEEKKTIIRDDVLVDLFDRAAGHQFINKGEKLKNLFKDVKDGMTNGQLSKELESLKEKAENKKQKIIKEMTKPSPL